MLSSPATPLSACSSGTRDQLLDLGGDRPRQIVWISTRGGANSGKTSTGMSRELLHAEEHHRRAGDDARSRNFRLEPIIHRINAPALLPW